MATKGIVFGGRTITVPGAYGFGDASDLVDISIGALNVVMIAGEAEGGQPNTPLIFGVGSQDRALKMIRGGNLAEAMHAAWNPSPDSTIKGADVIIAVRVNPATRAGTILLDTAGTPANAIQIYDRDWGKHGNGTQIGILAGKVDDTLRRVVVKKVADGVNQTSPDLGEILTIAYTGNGTATVDLNIVSSVPNLVVAISGATDGSASFTVDLTGKAVKTIEKLAAFIQAQTGFNVKVLSSPQMPSAQLDPIGTAVPVPSTGAILRGINGACVDWINRNAISAIAEFIGNAATVAVIGPVFLTGGTEGTTTINEWKQAFAKLGNEPGYILVPCTDDEAVHAAATDHIITMSDIKIKRRRQGYYGHGIGDVVFAPDGSVDITNLADRIFRINSDRVVFATPGVYVNDMNGDNTLFPSWLLAAIMAGIKAGGDPQQALTGKYVKITDVEGNYDPTLEEEVIAAAASYVTKVPNKGFRIGIGQLAQLRTTNTLQSEPSVLHVADVVLTNLEDYLGDKYVGIPPTSVITVRLNQIKRDVEKMLDQAAADGMLVGGLKDGKAVGPYRNVKVTFSNRTYAVEFEASIAEPGNYITILAHWSAVQGVAA